MLDEDYKILNYKKILFNKLVKKINIILKIF